MRVFIVKTTRLAAALVLGLSVYLIGCVDKKGTQPQPAKDYRVYFADADHRNTLFALHTLTGVVDSFTLPFELDSGFVISPEGKIMYINTGHSIVAFSLDSMVMIYEQPITVTGDEVSISPDGKYLAILGDGLHILNISNFSIAFTDTSYSFNGRFAHDSKAFYCATFDDQGHMFANVISMEDSATTERKYFNDGGAWMIVPDGSGTKWFLFLAIWNDYFWFEVLDANADSIIFRKSIVPGHGDMEITPNGRYLIFSQPGRLNSDVPPPDYFTIFDIHANQVYREVSTNNIPNDTIYANFLVGDLCVTPDGQRLIGLSALGGGEIFDFNLITMKYNRYVFLGSNKYPINLTCQSLP